MNQFPNLDGMALLLSLTTAACGSLAVAQADPIESSARDDRSQSPAMLVVSPQAASSPQPTVATARKPELENSLDREIARVWSEVEPMGPNTQVALFPPLLSSQTSRYSCVASELLCDRIARVAPSGAMVIEGSTLAGRIRDAGLDPAACTSMEAAASLAQAIGAEYVIGGYLHKVQTAKGAIRIELEIFGFRTRSGVETPSRIVMDGASLGSDDFRELRHGLENKSRAFAFGNHPDAAPQSSDSTDSEGKLLTALEKLTGSVVSENANRIANGATIWIAPTQLPGSEPLYQLLFELKDTLEAKRFEIEEVAAKRGTRAKDVLGSEDCPVTIGGRTFAHWNAAYEKLLGEWNVKLDVTSIATAQRSLAAGIRSRLLANGAATAEQLAIDNSAQAIRSFQQGRPGQPIGTKRDRVARTAAPDFSLMSQVIRQSDTLILVTAYLIDERTGEQLGDRSSELHGDIATSILKRYGNADLEGPKPADLDFEKPKRNDEDAEEGDDEDSKRREKKDRIKASEIALSRVEVLFCVNGASATRIAEAVENSPASQGIPFAKTWRMTSSGNGLVPPLAAGSACEIRYDDGNPAGKAAAERILKHIRSVLTKENSTLAAEFKACAPRTLSASLPAERFSRSNDGAIPIQVVIDR